MMPTSVVLDDPLDVRDISESSRPFFDYNDIIFAEYVQSWCGVTALKYR
jgi:hypothetical protein